LLAVTYISRRAYLYEYIPLTAFAGIGEIGAYFGLKALWAQRPPELAKIHFSSTARKVLVVVLFFAIVASNGLLGDTVFFRTEKTGVERISSAVRDTWHPDSAGGEPSILLYNSGDEGFFQLTGYTPKLRVFYMPMMNYQAYPDLVDAQDGYVRAGLPDYIITVWSDDQYMYPITEMNPAYKIIARENQVVEGSHIYMTLFAKE